MPNPANAKLYGPAVYCLAIITMSVGALKFPEKGDPFSGKGTPVEEFTE
jgi:hypothetical protein